VSCKILLSNWMRVSCSGDGSAHPFLALGVQGGG